MDGRETWRDAGRLDRTGRVLVVAGGLITLPLFALSTLALAWFITYFGDDSGECELACQAGNPLWYIAMAVIAVVALAIARMVRGGTIALVLGGLLGLTVALCALVTLPLVARGGWSGLLGVTYVVAMVGGGLALAIGATARLRARRAFSGAEPYPPLEG